MKLRTRQQKKTGQCLRMLLLIMAFLSKKKKKQEERGEKTGLVFNKIITLHLRLDIPKMAPTSNVLCLPGPQWKGTQVSQYVYIIKGSDTLQSKRQHCQISELLIITSLHTAFCFILVLTLRCFPPICRTLPLCPCPPPAKKHVQ